MCTVLFVIGRRYYKIYPATGSVIREMMCSIGVTKTVYIYNVVGQHFVHKFTARTYSVCTLWAIKKQDTFIFVITLANIDRFS